MVAIIVGGVSLVSWTVSSKANFVLTSLTAIGPMTAAAFILAGLSLRLSPAAGQQGRHITWARGLGVAVLLFGALDLLSMLSWGAGFDRLLLRDAPGGIGLFAVVPLLFLLDGLALALLDAGTRREFGLVQPFASGAAAVSLFGLVGFGFSAQPSDSATSLTVIPFVPAVIFAVLSVGVLCARPDRGVMAVVTGPGAGGSIVRWLLPVAVAVPVAIGWLRLLGEQAGLYGAEFGVSLMVVSTVVCLVIALWLAGRSLERIDLERLRAHEELRTARDELEVRVRLRTEELASANAALKAQVAEREHAEESIRGLNANLRERVAQLSAVNRDLEQQTLENEAFVYSVSHDLRSPLVNLQGFSKELGLACEEMRELFAENSLPEAVRKRGLDLIDGEVEESIQFIRTAVLRLSDIIDALLRLSRAGRVEYRPERADLGETVRRVVESMSGTIAGRGATVTVRDLPPARGDRTALEQVFANLIGNALNYLDPARPGEVEVGCLPAEGGAGGANRTYFVRDNGRGIPAGAEAKVFQALQRLHPDAAKGEGMGLAIVRRIVERHGGRIWYESAVGAGTTFFVELPSASDGTPRGR